MKNDAEASLESISPGTATCLIRRIALRKFCERFQKQNGRAPSIPQVRFHLHTLRIYADGHTIRRDLKILNITPPRKIVSAEERIIDALSKAGSRGLKLNQIRSHVFQWNRPVSAIKQILWDLAQSGKVEHHPKRAVWTLRNPNPRPLQPLSTNRPRVIISWGGPMEAAEDREVDLEEIECRGGIVEEMEERQAANAKAEFNKLCGRIVSWSRNRLPPEMQQLFDEVEKQHGTTEAFQFAMWTYEQLKKDAPQTLQPPVAGIETVETEIPKTPAEIQIDSIAKKIRKRDGISIEKAVDRAWKENPSLYGDYIRQYNQPGWHERVQNALSGEPNLACGNCNRRLDSDSNFCPYCGTGQKAVNVLPVPKKSRGPYIQ